MIQDAPSEFAHQFMYPGGGFALGNALGRVQIVDRQGLSAGLARTCRISPLAPLHSAFLLPEC